MRSTIKKIMLKYRYHTPPPTLRILYDGKQVAELRRDKPGSFCFRYLDAFKELSLQPLPGLPVGEEYTGRDLPLYFRERLPDVRRADIRKLVTQFGIPTDDELLLLATLGKHTITDPFEFQLSAA